jgi:perosamine synthetase
MSDRLAIDGGTPAVASPLAAISPVDDVEREAVARALADAPLTTLFGGFEVGAFEEEFAARMGAAHAVAVTSGTAALHAALRALEIGPLDEVVVTPFSFIASVSVVVECGATPVFADIDDDSLGLDVDAVRAAMSSRTKAILPVHQSGYPVDMTRLCALAEEYNVPIVEDCAVAHGARVGKKSVGTLGTLGCFSFNIGKILRTGEGGMILTEDEDLAYRCRAIRVNGLVPGPSGPTVAMFGCNYTMPQPIAAIGRIQIQRLDAILARRAEHAAVLRSTVDGVNVTTPVDPSDRTRTFCEIPFRLAPPLAAHRDAVVVALCAENVPASVGRRTPLYDVDFLRPFAPNIPCRRAERACAETFFIDPRPHYTNNEIAAIAHGLRKVFENLDWIIRQP